jgi:hypothetical protein
MSYPKTYGPKDAPVELLRLVDRLVPLLIEGAHPALSALRQQFSGARIKQVELTGVGFYVDFEVASDTPLAEPANFSGGDARITVEGVENGAGCVLFVSGGRLATLEGYTYGGDTWLEAAVALSVDDVFPVLPDKAG